MNFLRCALPLVLAASSAATFAQDAKPGDKSAADKPTIANDLPADKSVAQSIQMGGKTLKYTATVGTLPVKNEKGERWARWCSPRIRWMSRTGR